jgi:hypothetical protein
MSVRIQDVAVSWSDFHGALELTLRLLGFAIALVDHPQQGMHFGGARVALQGQLCALHRLAALAGREIALGEPEVGSARWRRGGLA